MVETAGLQLHHWQLAGVQLLHAVIVAQQISHRAAAGQACGDESKKLSGVGALQDKANLMPPRILRLTG